MKHTFNQYIDEVENIIDEDSKFPVVKDNKIKYVVRPH